VCVSLSVLVLGTQSSPEEWELEDIDGNHNAGNPQEAALVREQHPGEDDCIMETNWGTRVLGAMAVTRGLCDTCHERTAWTNAHITAVGDYYLKLPLPWVEVWLRYRKDLVFQFTTIEAWKARILTPPYLSNVADVRHVTLDPIQDGKKRFLILSSDGLYDLRPEDQSKTTVAAFAKEWMKAAAKAQDAGSHLAMEVLRCALGGEDEAKVSAMLTLENEERWTDDVTVVIRPL
jgi:pyruvate dehydrogenase phosphatase